MKAITAPIRAAAMLFTMLLMLAACSTADTLQISSPQAPAPERPSSEKYSAIVVDVNSGKVLYDADSEQSRYPASLTKMMTLYLLFEALESGRVSLSTQIPVSDHARSQAPSKLGFKPGETIDADTAIRAIAVKSANDVAVAVGEYLGGTEDQFAQMMTARARTLGMRGTTFRNASGLPDDGQITTARDMALLGMSLRKRFPSQFAYFSNQTFTFRGRTIKGHNDLIGRVPGVDGIKTGYIRASGFNICTSVSRSGRKLVVCVFGGKTARARNDHVEQLIEHYLLSATQRGV
jgi:D-alanyl-D-alanine carboxypeptidase